MLPRDAHLPPGVSSLLVVDLDAIIANYRRMQALAPRAETGVSIKADAYGLGARTVAPALAAAGCRSFYVATAAEGVALRKAVAKAEIVVLNGPDRASLPLYTRHDLTPTLNSPEQIELWRTSAARRARPAYLHVDTGMSRLGLSAPEVAALAAPDSALGGLNIAVVMSHLACADVLDSPMNAEQRARLLAAADQLRSHAGAARLSLANSAGAFLGRRYHFDLVRAGASIYGLNVLKQKRSKMNEVAYLYGKILQVRTIGRGVSVGYEATYRARRRTRVATVATGYADGYLRTASRRTAGRPISAYIGDTPAPLIGAVSMDLLTIDVSGIAPEAVEPGAFVELLGSHVGADDLADAAGTIGYEVLTRLGQRHHRVYRGGD